MKLNSKIWLLVAAMTFSALGAEALGEVVPLKPEVSTLPTWAVQLLGAGAAAMGIWALWGVKQLVNLIFTQKWQEGAKAGAITALEHGIQEAEEELAAYMKEAAADGKLTREEIDKLKELAFRRAKQIATGPALQLLEQWGMDIAGNLISQLVQGKKQAAPTVVVNAANVDSINAPTNSNVTVTDEVTTAAAGVTASATIVRAPREIHTPCDRAPQGWYCTRNKDHEGPCAAKPTDETIQAARAVLASI